MFFELDKTTNSMYKKIVTSAPDNGKLYIVNQKQSVEIKKGKKN